MNGSKPISPAGIGRTPGPGHSRCAVRLSVSSHPSHLPRGEGEPFSLRSAIQVFRLCLRGARCSPSLSWSSTTSRTAGHRGNLSSQEDRYFAVPKGQSRIAQRFNAGLDAKRSRVPKGRLRSNPTPHPSAVPSGLVCHAPYFPALKRRAILKMSLRDSGKAGGFPK